MVPHVALRVPHNGVRTRPLALLVAAALAAAAPAAGASPWMPPPKGGITIHTDQTLLPPNDGVEFKLFKKITGRAPQREDRDYMLPVARRFVTTADALRPHHDYPAWDLSVPVGTKVFAVRGGRVKDITTSGYCGVGLVVNGSDGFEYTYCHGSALGARPGRRIRTGDAIMLSGNTGRSTGPHLHLQIRASAGALVCPQAAIADWLGGGEMSPAGLGSSGCWYATPDKDKKGKKKHGRQAARRRLIRRQWAEYRRRMRQWRKSQQAASSAESGSSSEGSAGSDGSDEASGSGSGGSDTPKPEPTPEPSAEPTPTTSSSPSPEPEPTASGSPPDDGGGD